MDYGLVAKQVAALIEDEPHYIPALSNISSVLMQELPDLNWAGFYLLRGETLVVGPFQGKPACIHIGIGKGVCGTAVAENRTVLVENVHDFPGHIACDGASNSEIVLPLYSGQEIKGVLDLDSPVIGRFTEEDRKGLETVASLISGAVIWAE